MNPSGLEEKFPSVGSGKRGIQSPWLCDPCGHFGSPWDEQKMSTSLGFSSFPLPGCQRQLEFEEGFLGLLILCPL